LLLATNIEKFYDKERLSFFAGFGSEHRLHILDANPV
jgi:hypothetical protein